MKIFFISSTFKDMQAERDMLHSDIIPEINHQLKKVHEEIQEWDLRWGVDTSLMTEEESGRYVIESCIDAIDRCKPYMIILIGERYGWIPDEAAVSQTRDDRIICQYAEPISITQMEIVYGALSREQLDRCVFCFRNEGFSDSLSEDIRDRYRCESMIHRQKLDSLKKRIRSTPGAIIMDYSPVVDASGLHYDLTDFKNQLVPLLWDMLGKEISKKSTYCLEKQILENADRLTNHYLSTYLPRNGVDGSKTMAASLWYYGESGIGKSSFSASVYSNTVKVGCKSFIYYCGEADCADPDNLLNTLWYWLNQMKDSAHFPDSLKREQKLSQIVKFLLKSQDDDIVLIIDGIDQLSEDITRIILSLHKAITARRTEKSVSGLMVTSLQSFFEKHADTIRASGMVCNGIGLLEPVEVIPFIQKHTQARGKHIDAAVQRSILHKKECRNPFYLKLLLTRLFMMDKEELETADSLSSGMKGISLYMEKLIAELPESISLLIWNVFETAFYKLQQIRKDIRIGANTADPRLVVKLIAFSHGGVTMEDLSEMLAYRQLSFIPFFFQRLFCYLPDLFDETSEGKWILSHRLVTESVVEMTDKTERRRIDELICRKLLEKQDYSKCLLYALRISHTKAVNQCLEKICEQGQNGIMSFIRKYFDEFWLLFHDIPTEEGREEPVSEALLQFASKLILRNAGEAFHFYDLSLHLLHSYETHGCVSDETTLYVAMAEAVLAAHSSRKSEFLSCCEKAMELFCILPDQMRSGIVNDYFLFLTMIFDGKYYTELNGKILDSLSIMVVNQLYSQDKQREGILIELYTLSILWSKYIREQNKESLDYIYAQLSITLQKVSLYSYDLMNELNVCALQAVYTHCQFLAEKYIGMGEYHAAMNTLKLSQNWYKGRMVVLPDIRDYVQYARHLVLRADCVKNEYMKKYLEEAIQQYDMLYAIYQFDGFKEMSADVCMKMIKVLEKTESVQERSMLYPSSQNRDIMLMYRKAGTIYQELLEKNRDNPSIPLIEKMSGFYYRFLMRHLSGDIWNWCEDAQIDRHKTPEDFMRRMEEAISRNMELSDLLIKLKPEYDQYVDRVWSALCGVYYYDLHQEPEKAFSYIDKMLQLIEETHTLFHKEDDNYTVELLIGAAECAVRYGDTDRAREIASRCWDVLQRLEDPSSANPYNKSGYIVKYVKSLIVMEKVYSISDPVRCRASFVRANDCLKGINRFEIVLSERYDYLRSDVFQTMGECCYYHGEYDDAEKYLQAAAGYWPEDKLLQDFGSRELQMQQYFRALNGMELLALIRKNTKLLHHVLERYQGIVINCTTEQDSRYRPLLLQHAEKIRDYYLQEFPHEELPESLRYILLLSKQERKKADFTLLRRSEDEILEMIKAWEDAHDDPYQQKYADLLDRLSDIQSKMLDDLRQDEDDIERSSLISRHVAVSRKLADYYFAAGNETKALRMELYYMNMIEKGKVKETEEFNLESCVERWITGKAIRNAQPYSKRNQESVWLEFLDLMVRIYRRLFDRTRAPEWIYRAISECREYRVFRINRLPEGHEDWNWNMEQVYEIDDIEESIYLHIQGEEIFREEEWLLPLLKLINEQTAENNDKTIDLLSEKLMILYDIQCLPITYQTEVSKLIDVLVERIHRTAGLMKYAMISAVIHLDPDVTITEVENYYHSIKEKNS